jgi:hypothetical protein
MNEELQKSLGQILDWCNQGGDFVKEQAPLYAQELISFYILERSLAIAFILIFMAAMLYSIRFLPKKVDRKVDGYLADNDARSFAIGGMLFVFVTLAICLFSSACDIAKAKMAPRVLIVEHIQGKLESK